MTDAPYGMFFKIREEAFGFIAVQLREPRKRFGSRLVAEALIYPGEHPSGAAAVEFGKARALRWYRNAVHDAKTYREVLGER